MKPCKIITLISIAILTACAAPAINPRSTDRGMALFNDPKLGNGTSGNSCGTCHPDGKDLEKLGGKVDAEMVNRCISMALKGRPLDVNSEQMKDLLFYINTIKPKVGEVKEKRKSAVAC